MKPWETLGRARTPDGSELVLRRHPSEFVILVNGESLMSSRSHRSEDALAVLGSARARTKPRPQVVVGGLGMGFTLRAALDILPPEATVVVAELVLAVVEWNRGPLGPLANHPLDDPRVVVDERDVRAVMQSNPGRFDAVLLDTDNGPEALTASSNVGLYDRAGLAVARASLAPGGVLAVWSVEDDRRFKERLSAAGFTVRTERVRRRAKSRGHRDVILVAEPTQNQ
jgi:spermidine synthase